jgi:molybdenum cofactor synthesis domain-containing protein
VSGLVPLDDAQAVVRSGCPRLDPVTMTAAEAVGCVTAEPVRAAELVPPFANTAMDGFAVRAEDTSPAPASLAIVGTLAAGAAPTRAVGEGEAIRIMTGAPMPPGADSVVMVERTRVDEDGARVEILESATSGDHVRDAGDDMRPGDEVIAEGTALGAAHIGVLATLGIESVAVVPRARVGVFSTGDELVEGPVELAPGQIRDSNRAALKVLLDQAGCTVVDLGLVADDEEAIAAAVTEGVARCDALVTSGGVSMGDYDYVKVALDRLGAMTWMQVAIRPAKPLAFGRVEGTPVFGLPGNPVSSMVSFELFARPALRQMMGHRQLDRRRVRAIADGGLARRPDGKTHFFRVVSEYRDGAFHVRSAGGQGSHQRAAMAAADALAVVPAGDGIPPGGDVDLLLLA